ncbi:MAG: hypothetical protein CW716_09720 [Candidatus Bathyarchaeum sp.]|nr:MAG: hypothetical protein CW716_09720 [Candidatus Bathyarchaeum sp.]
MRACIYTSLFVLIILFATFSSVLSLSSNSWKNQTIDEGGAIGFQSLVLDSKGNPRIAYVGYANGSWHNPLTLMYACWSEAEWIIENVTLGSGYPSIVLDSNDNPHIVFGSSFVTYASLDSTGWSFQTVDRGNSGWIALDSNDEPHLVYKGTNGLQYARFTEMGWQIETIDELQNASSRVYLEIDANNNPHVLYGCEISGPQGALIAINYATRNSSGWSIQTVVSDAGSGNFGNLALDSKSYPHFVYIRPQIHPDYGYYTPLNTTQIYVNWNGSTWNTQEVASNIKWHGIAGFLALDSQDYPHVVYYNETTDDSGVLFYSRITGTVWDNQIIDSGNALNPSSIALDANGTPHIAYLGRPVHPSIYIAHIKYATLSGSAEDSTTPLTMSISSVVIIVTTVTAGVCLLIYSKKRNPKIEKQQLLYTQLAKTSNWRFNLKHISSLIVVHC